MGDMPNLLRGVHECLIIFSLKINFMGKESPNSSFWTSPMDDPARVEDMGLDNT
jgi:hypothetical protein